MTDEAEKIFDDYYKLPNRLRPSIRIYRSPYDGIWYVCTDQTGSVPVFDDDPYGSTK